jgi:hypothetical protein
MISNEGESVRVLQNEELDIVVGGAFSPEGCLPNFILLPGEPPFPATPTRDLFQKYTIG